MEPKEQKTYDNFFEFWKAEYPNQPDWVKQIALRTWDVCVDGMTIDMFSDQEIIDKYEERGYKV